MLEPENRHLLTDALRPPAGFTVEAALATTYTLDLHSLLLAPLAMAAYDHTEGDDHVNDASTPVALLESIRRHSEHTVVLCQAAGIQVPPAYPRLAAFAEGIVGEVAPPPGGTFHPKIWLLRFADAEGQQRHRFACLSRNLTGDRSWDTLLVCDEDPEAAATLDPGPVCDFVVEAMDSLVRPLDEIRQSLIADLCRSMREARLAVPAPFESARAVPLGTPSGSAWPLPATAAGWTVVSPFLEASALRRLPKTDGRRLLLSRSDAFDRVGSDACAGAQTVVLQAMADVADLDELLDEQAEPGTPPSSVPPRGLHAKLFCWEDEAGAHVLTGSANCTGAAFGSNIEMAVLLSGPRKSCGLGPVLGDEKSGLLQLTQPYDIPTAEGEADPVYEVERRIEGWHAALAAAKPVLRVAESGDGYTAQLDLVLPDDPHDLGPHTTARPVGLKNASPRPIGEAAAWQDLGLHALSPYLVLSTTAEVEGEELTRECVILCEVTGAPEDRLRRLLRDMLSTPQEILRYLTLLLGDISADDLLDRLKQDAEEGPDDPDKRPGGAFGSGFDDLVLLEPLVRAAARGDDSLERAHRLLEDLKGDDGELPELDEHFHHIWNAVWEASRS